MKLRSGETVIDRPGSHLHEGVQELLVEALARIDSKGRQFIEAEVDFSRVIGESTLVETGLDDIIVYAQRPKRAGLTRFVKNRTTEPRTTLVLILKKGNMNQVPGEYYVMLTGYIGHITPGEPWNERDFVCRPDPDKARREAREFWDKHALVYGAEPILPGTETSVCPW